jgi:hypothetical protein
VIYNQCRHKESRNLFNYILGIAFPLFLLDRAVGILLDLLVGNSNYIYVSIWAFFQVPQDLLELAVLA